MNSKKIIMILLLLITITSTITAVSSSGFLDMMEITPYDEDTVVQIDDFKFTIPEGYGESEGDRTNTTNDYGITIIQYNYFNDDGKLVGVTVIYNGSDVTFDDFDTTNYTQKTIVDKEGMYKTGNNSVDFFYIENGKKYVSLTAPDDATLEKMMKVEE